MEKINVLIADDHRVVRDGIKSILNKEDEINVIGEAQNGAEALTLARELNPDIILTDITMPEMTGIELANEVGKELPEIKVIILSMHEDEEYISKVVEAKASGYLGKEVEKEEIILAIKRVYGGGNYYSENVSKMMIEGFVKKTTSGGNDGPAVHLTNREKEILKLVVDGASSKAIAGELFISIRTVETHRNNILQKLNVKNSAELVKYALKHKLVEV